MDRCWRTQLCVVVLVVRVAVLLSAREGAALLSFSLSGRAALLLCRLLGVCLLSLCACVHIWVCAQGCGLVLLTSGLPSTACVKSVSPKGA